jgi:glycine/D-amino acid oxidase-like deaminating enzyme
LTPGASGAGLAPAALPPRVETIVIGGGIVGICVAGFLAAGGMEVLILDSGHGAGSTSNAGSLHVQMQSRFMRLYPDQVAGMEAQLPLYRAAVAFWRSLGTVIDADFGLQMTGGLMVAESEEQLGFLADKARRERAAGLDVEILGQEELARLAPYLGPAIVGAAFCGDEGKIDPLAANLALRRWAAGQGVRRIDGVAVEAVTSQSGGWCVAAAGQAIACRRVVLAAGAGSAPLAHALGIALPARAEPLHMSITEPTTPMIGHLVQHADRMITLKQLHNGQVVIGGGWPARDATPRHAPLTQSSSLAGSVGLARHVVPGVAGLEIIRAWAGNNTVVDGRGVLGPIAGHDGLHVAIPGDAGYTLGPLSARAVADAMLGHPPVIDLAGFAAARFRAAAGMQA